MLKPRTFFLLLAVLAVGALVFAKAIQSKRDASSATLSYFVYGEAIGDQEVYVDLSINPTWPTSDQKQIWYSGYACTISYCTSWGCSCDWPYDIEFYGYGNFPADTLQIDPQGQARLMFDVATLSDGYSEGCETIEIEWTPSGELHTSQHGQFRAETPTSVEHSVSREDIWHSTAEGSVCGVAVAPPATGYVQRLTLLNVARELK